MQKKIECDFCAITNEKKLTQLSIIVHVQLENNFSNDKKTIENVHNLMKTIYEFEINIIFRI